MRSHLIACAKHTLSVALTGLVALLALGNPALGNPLFQVRTISNASMSPTLRVGDLIVILPGREPDVGDIATFRVNGAVVTHRVVGRAEDGAFQTRGDANEAPDVWSDSRVELIGTYAFRIPWLGYVTLLGQGGRVSTSGI